MLCLGGSDTAWMKIPRLYGHYWIEEGTILGSLSNVKVICNENKVKRDNFITFLWWNNVKCLNFDFSRFFFKFG
jgi:hypothetical protein